MPQLLVLSPRSGGPSRRPQVAFGSDHLRPRGRCLGPIPGGLGGASCLLLASPCWTWDCQKVGALGQRWEDGRGRGLGLLPPHCVGHGFMLQGWFCPSEPRWTPSRRRAKGRLAQIGSTPVVFFSLAFGRVVWAKATMLHNYALASVWEVPCFRLTGGDGHARLTTGSW